MTIIEYIKINPKNPNESFTDYYSRLSIISGYTPESIRKQYGIVRALLPVSINNEKENENLQHLKDLVLLKI